MYPGSLKSKRNTPTSTSKAHSMNLLKLCKRAKLWFDREEVNKPLFAKTLQHATPLKKHNFPYPFLLKT